ncbi:A/G-specific adenine glycosylase [Iodidimonas nitroreducens]|uniref:A/G-specific adenine glycosylase n=1 Tax=Iodidimonas nitroreducens TaxID=1236968 RepID=UPI0028D52613|nr:A/G-specific adenine glycosylase [Iodidimonas nitroreducens]
MPAEPTPDEFGDDDRLTLPALAATVRDPLFIIGFLSLTHDSLGYPVGSRQTSIRKSQKRSQPISRDLLLWYDRHRRDLPWRAAAGERSDPYAVWLSEIMLQQTTVTAVKPYFERFMARWPGVRDLAAAPLEAVLDQWAGLGYYARARNLHACAIIISRDHDGLFPDNEAALKRLPGIGDYTAAAIAAIAFDRPAAAVDGNVERVISRLYHITQPLPAAKKPIRAQTLALVPDDRPGDFAQALMDLGAVICTPRQPRCPACPWQAHCRAAAKGDAESLPVKAPKKQRPIRHALAFWLEKDGAVFVRRRPAKGLLGGMLEIPTSPWLDTPPLMAEAMAHAPYQAQWSTLPGEVRHVFTHFELLITVLRADQPISAPKDGHWLARDQLDGLPGLMQKIARHALAAQS